jgi:peroxiredoxin
MLDTILASRATRSRGVALLLLLAVALVPAGAAAQPSRTPPTTKTPGQTRPIRGKTVPQSTSVGRFLVGDVAPEMKLNDHTGRTFTLSVERKGKPWLLVFIRRADELAGAESVAGELGTLGIGAAVIAPFGHERVLEWVHAPRLPVLFDRASVTARTYGVYDPVTGNPRPGAFLVDRRGRILWLISGGLPSGAELVRMTREALEASEALEADSSASSGR